MREAGKRTDRTTLAQYSLLLLSVGVMTGYFLTLCPDTQRRLWWAPILMYVCYAVMWLFVIASFFGISEQLRGVNSGKD